MSIIPVLQRRRKQTATVSHATPSGFGDDTVAAMRCINEWLFLFSVLFL